MTVAIVACGLALSFTSCATQEADGPGALSSVSYQQSKAVPDYDSDAYETSEETQLSELSDVLQQYDWTPGWEQAEAEPGCVGGTTTKLGLTFSDGTDEVIEMYSCGQEAEPFVTAVTELVESWH